MNQENTQPEKDGFGYFLAQAFAAAGSPTLNTLIREHWGDNEWHQLENLPDKVKNHPIQFPQLLHPEFFSAAGAAGISGGSIHAVGLAVDTIARQIVEKALELRGPKPEAQ